MKRLRWFITGASFGVGASIWIRRKIKSKVQEVTPLAVSKAALDSALVLKDRVSEAILDAKNEFEATEADLRREMGLLPKRKTGVR